MATRIKFAGKTYDSKSEAARAMFAAEKSVTEVSNDLKIGYAFAYGIAKRAGFATTAAKRRATRAVSETVEEYRVVTEAGIIAVNKVTGKSRKVK